MSSSPSSDTDWDAFLFEAAGQGNLPAMEEAIYSGANVNYRAGAAFTNCLQAAVTIPNGNRYQALKMLLDNGAEVDLANRKGYTALRTAISANQRGDLAQLLLDYGADPNLYSKSGRISPSGAETALHEAARKGWHNLAGILLDAGADPLLPDMYDRTARGLTHKVYAKVHDMLDEYESLPRIDLDAVLSKAALFAEHNGKTPLQNPVTWRNWSEIADKLHEKGEPVTKAELLSQTENGKPFLLVAAQARMLGAVVADLNRHGESLSVEELQGVGEAMNSILCGHSAPNALFTYDNLHLQGKGALQRNLAALPPEGREELGNLHVLKARLQADEPLQQRGR